MFWVNFEAFKASYKAQRTEPPARCIHFSSSAADHTFQAGMMCGHSNQWACKQALRRCTIMTCCFCCLHRSTHRGHDLGQTALTSPTIRGSCPQTESSLDLHAFTAASNATLFLRRRPSAHPCHHHGLTSVSSLGLSWVLAQLVPRTRWRIKCPHCRSTRFCLY